MLTTRRIFLRSAVSVGVLTLPTWSMTAEADGHGKRLQFDRVFYDARQLHALTFAETASKLGARSHAIPGAVDDPSYEDLRCRWRIAKTPLAGITDSRVLCLLQMMARDAGMRTVLRIHHCSRGASMQHDLFGSSALREAWNAYLPLAGARWSHVAARLVLSLRAGDVGAACDGEQTRAAKPRAVDSRMLVTWAIA